MRINKHFMFILSLCTLSLAVARAQSVTVPLYAGSIPNAREIPADSLKEFLDTSRGYYGNVRIPTLTIYPCKPGKKTGTAIIVFPGGGYRVLVDEAASFAQAFNDEGITVFAVKYRLPNKLTMLNSSIGPLQDAQMAIKYVRMHAGEFGIDEHKIGVLGSSAGGHLATTEANHPKTIVIDNKENTNLRPDFMVLLYPVISFLQYPLKETVQRLLGPGADSSSLVYFSNERHVTSATPPTFLLHAADDDRVSVQHSLLYYDALLKAKVPAELHILANGGHAFGLEHPARGNEWLQWCMSWLRENGFGSVVSLK